MDREERERRNHIRRWACLMIMHLEGREADPPRYTYEEALARLRELVDRELETHVRARPTLPDLGD